jgi:hypothetical protein
VPLRFFTPAHCSPQPSRLHSLPPQLQPAAPLARFADVWEPVCRGLNPPAELVLPALPPRGPAPPAAGALGSPTAAATAGVSGRGLARVRSAPAAGGAADPEALALAVGGAAPAPRLSPVRCARSPRPPSPTPNSSP